MKWIPKNNHREAVQEYHLLENDESKVVLKFNPQQNAARIYCGGQQRLFFIESAGALTGKYIFNNEYGFEIGSVTQDKHNMNGGVVIIEGKKYRYEITEKDGKELSVYENGSNRPLMNCAFGYAESRHSSGLSFAKNMDYKSFLLAMCWYLFLPVAKESAIEYAA